MRQARAERGKWRLFTQHAKEPESEWLEKGPDGCDADVAAAADVVDAIEAKTDEDNEAG